MIRRSIWFQIGLISLFVVIQSTILKNIFNSGYSIDLALLILIFTSYSHGSIHGELSGFITGLIEDFLSLSPLGFHALIKTVLGFIYGNFKGKVFIDPIFIPILLAIVATFFKALSGFLLKVIFLSGGNLFTFGLLIEIGINAFAAPFVFALLKLFKIIRSNEQDQY